MIVKCPLCAARYRVDDEVFKKKEGLRFRCSRCGHVFDQPRSAAPPVDKSVTPREPAGPEEDDFKRIAELLDDIKTGGGSADSADTGDEEEEATVHVSENHDIADPPTVQRSLLTTGRFIFLVLCLVLAWTTIILWQSSPLRTSVTVSFTKVLLSLEGWIGSRDQRSPAEQARQNVELVDVQESIHDNWIAGKILIIEGIAMNRNDFSLSSIRVRGKLMDSDRKVIAETESFCGNLLSEAELRNLTKKEIERELLMPSGRDQRGVTVPPGGPIPFMLAFVNPTEEAGLFVVELVDVTPSMQNGAR
ncbi:MAG: DUF3426 domain-containing protein [Syntrophales bacterium]|nr:DUF3426 domain-containing protein [Syntrophales bacterium]